MTDSIKDNSITQPPSNSAINSPRVDFDKSRFSNVIYQKGYDVYKETAFVCPCISNGTGGNNAQSNCLNCGGSGWVFVNPYETKMVLQSINLQSQYKEWSEQKLGTVKITAEDQDQLSFMDRITLKYGETIHKEGLHLKQYDTGSGTEYFFLTTYEIKQTLKIFAFDGVQNPLNALVEGTDYEIQNNKIKVINSNLVSQNLSISILYKYMPQFNVLDLPRETMVTNVKLPDKNGRLVATDLPVSAIARRTHFIQNFQPYYWSTSQLIDNSYMQQPFNC